MEYKEFAYQEGSPIYVGKGVWLKVLEGDVTLLQKYDNIQVIYNETLKAKIPFIQSELLDESYVKLEILNRRGEKFRNDIDLTGLKMEGCGCTYKTINKKSLKNNESAIIELKYSKIVGEINMNVKVLSNEDNFVITLKGKIEVDEQY